MFEINKVYERRELHRLYRGNSQGGISPCAYHPLIMIFSSKSGTQHGYEDEWQGEYFYYTGEGQIGDMKFIRGNKAIRDHEQDHKAIHLFVNERPTYVRYCGELQLVDYDFVSAPDREGNIRKSIRFKFARHRNQSFGESHFNKLSNYNKPNRTERQGLVTSRVGQGAYRKGLIERWGAKCAVTGCSLTPILIASHIVPWKDATHEERLDLDNGILLSPILDALFDKHLISFGDRGRIVFSGLLGVEHVQLLGLSSDLQITQLTKGNRIYLRRHRERLLKKACEVMNKVSNA